MLSAVLAHCLKTGNMQNTHNRPTTLSPSGRTLCENQHYQLPTYRLLNRPFMPTAAVNGIDLYEPLTWKAGTACRARSEAPPTCCTCSMQSPQGRQRSAWAERWASGDISSRSRWKYSEHLSVAVRDYPVSPTLPSPYSRITTTLHESQKMARYVGGSKSRLSAFVSG